MAESLFSPLPVGAVYEAPVVEETVLEVNETVENTVVTEEAPIVEEVVATTAGVKETIREVEKIVEKYPEMDEYTTEMFNALMEGKEDVLYTYLAEKNRDYKTMSDYDVVKANLMKANPNLTDEIAELKMERTYREIYKVDTSKINKEESPDEYEEATDHNKKVEENLKLLKLDAFDARLALEASKKDIKLPKIKTNEVEVPKQPTAEEIAQGRATWEATVNEEVPKVKEFTWKIGDEDVNYKVSEDELKDNLEFMKNLNNLTLATELGWMDKDGKQNVAKIAGDVRKLKSIDKLIASAYSQGKAAGAKGTAEKIKNIDLTAKAQTITTGTPADIGLLAFGHLNPK